MKKAISVFVAVCALAAIGLFAAYCGGGGGGDKCPDKCGTGKECCEACPCSQGTCNAAGQCIVCPDACGAGKQCCNDCPCATDQECNADGQCVAKTCCPNAPAGKIHIDIDGMIMNVATQQGAQVFVAAIAPLAALSPGQPELLVQGQSDANGLFHLDCYDVTEVALGAVVITDDPNPDGAAGNFFPTGTGVKGWTKNDEKTCVDNAVAFALPTAMVTVIDNLDGVDAAANGFIMGLVLTSTGQPVQGAVVKRKEGSNWVDIDNIYYPNKDFNDFSGTTTSESGLFIIPGGGIFASVQIIRAEKTGLTFPESKVGSKGGFCFWSQNPAQ